MGRACVPLQLISSCKPSYHTIVAASFLFDPPKPLQVPLLLLLENGAVREAADVTEQPWWQLHSFVAAWRPDLDMEAWAASMRGHAAHPQGIQRQLDAIATLCPADVRSAEWELLVHEQLDARARHGFQWEEQLTSWVAGWLLLAACHSAHPPPTEIMPVLPGRDISSSGSSTSAAQGSPPHLPQQDILLAGRDQEAAAGAAAAATGSWPSLPSLEDYLLSMSALEADPGAQLDAMAALRPPAVSQGDWDRDLGKVRWTEEKEQHMGSCMGRAHTHTHTHAHIGSVAQ